MTENRREIYGDPTNGGDDPGSGFDDYLKRPERVTSWFAVIDGEVVGLTAMFDHGPSAEVEPIVVTGIRRRQRIGRALMERVVSMATQRGYEYLAIRPVARNVGSKYAGIQGRRRPVADSANEQTTDRIDDLVSIIYSCAAHRGPRQSNIGRPPQATRGSTWLTTVIPGFCSCWTP